MPVVYSAAVAIALCAFAPCAVSADALAGSVFCDRLRVMVATREANGALADYRWTLDGADAAPTVMRDLASPRTDAEYQQWKAQFPAAPVRTGIVEFAGLPPAHTQAIAVRSPAGATARLDVSTLPAELPGPADTAAFRVLLASCFHVATDGGRAGHSLAGMKLAPHLTIFMGDQVYLDLPTLADFRDDEAWLAAKFESDYVKNWMGDGTGTADDAAAGALTGALRLAPNAFIPDDHEFWNNAPFRSPFIQNSFTQNGRDRWKRAALRMVEAFQRAPAAAAGGVTIIDVDPLSILMLDSRSKRRETTKGREALIPRASAQELERWTQRLIARHQGGELAVGLFITGQSLLDPQAGFFTGEFADYALSNFEDDFAAIVAPLERAAAAGVPMLLATGDVHWGRVAILRRRLESRPSFVEVISSPLSLVESVGIDQWQLTKDRLASYFGKGNEWPRHSAPAPPPVRWGGERQFETRESETVGRRGDHALRLDFRRKGTGVVVEPVFLGLRPHEVGIDEQSAGMIELLPQR